MLAFNFKISLFSPCKFFTNKVCFTMPPVFITSFFQRQRVIIPKIISSVLSVCNNIFMVCSRDYNFTENEKIELMSYFVFLPEIMLTQAMG